MAENPYRVLPSITELAASIGDSTALRGPALTAFLQAQLDDERAAITNGATPSKLDVVLRVSGAVRTLERSRTEPVINGTGVIIHTNLGRAPLSESAAEAMCKAAASFVSLELDPETNQRGGRMSEVSALMKLLTGAEETLAVNNNAAAILLVLSALAAGKSVIVSRGEAVEIGGGFRIPDVLQQSGGRLVEVGTTNRTYLRDYEAAIDRDTALFLKVHASNFSVTGFVESTGIAELSDLSKRTGIPIVEDLGSGSLLQPGDFGLGHEPTIGESMASGADVITASGDKLLGGPQAGIIAGSAELVRRVARHPLARAVRADKTSLAGLAATLRHYARGDAEQEIPVWKMMSADIDSLRARGSRMRERLSEIGRQCDLLPTLSTVGGGSLPGQQQPSVALAFAAGVRPIDDFARALRLGTPRVFGRVERNQLLVDLRTVLPEQDDLLIAAIGAVFSDDAFR